MKHHSSITRWSRILMLVVLGFALIIPAGAKQVVHAAGIIYVDSTAAGLNNGTSWENAYTNLQSALATAVAGDEIWVAAGTYTPGNNRAASFNLKGGVTLLGGFPTGGGESFSRDWDANPTILSGDIGTPGMNVDNSYHVVKGSVCTGEAVIDGFIISNGYVEISIVNNNGGGLYIDRCQMILRNSIIKENYAYNFGGGMWASNTNVDFDNVTFLENKSVTTGGGFYFTGGMLNLLDVLFDGNTSGSAGGAYAFTLSSEMHNVNFKDNAATASSQGNAGGLLLLGGNTEIFDSEFNTNLAASGSGGGINALLDTGKNLILKNVFIHDNVSTGNCNLSSDTWGPGGGGAYIERGNLYVLNSRFSGNIVKGYGNNNWGYLYTKCVGAGLSSAGANTTVIGSIFDNNKFIKTGSIEVGYGAGIYTNGPTVIHNSVFSKNTAADWRGGFFGSANSSVTNSIFWPGGDAGGVTNFSIRYSVTSQTGTGNILGDPKYIDSANGNFRLRYDSPAIDAGDNTAIPADTLDLDSDGDITEPLPYDLDGQPRVAEMPMQPNTGNGDFPLVDMGAYEVSNTAPSLNNSGWPAFSELAEGSVPGNGNSIPELLASSGLSDPITDPDPGAQEGIAVIGVNNTGGKWQFTTNNGTAWTDFGTVSNSSATLLSAEDTNRIRFVPDTTYRGTISNGITFRAWDRSDGFTAGKTGAYLYVTGGPSPYSAQTETASIAVRSKNHTPTLNPISGINILEDQEPVSVNIGGIGPGVGDEGQEITVTATSLSPAVVPHPTVNYTSPQSTGSLLVRSAANTSGAATINVKVRDDGGTADGAIDNVTQTFRVTVLPVNDPPTLLTGSDPVVLEDSGKVTLTGWAKQITPGPSDEAAQTLAISLTAANPTFFSSQPFIDLATGTLNFQPAPNASGTTPVTIQLTDNGGTDNYGVNTLNTTFSITVQPVNDPPTIQKGPDQTVLEDAGSQVVYNWAQQPNPGPSNENTQTISITTTADNPALFSEQPQVEPFTGTLTYTPAQNASGATRVVIRLTDSGGTDNGGINQSETSFNITLTPVNDRPSLQKGSSPTVLEDPGTVRLANWATQINAGPTDEQGQTLQAAFTIDKPALFGVQPSLNLTTGELSFTPALNAVGSAQVTLTLSDNGGTANGGQNQFQTNFTITIQPVNDPPSFQRGADPIVLEDALPASYSAWATINAGPPDEYGQTLSMTVTADNSALFSTQPAIDLTTGKLTFTPAANVSGTTRIVVSLFDDGGIENGGVDHAQVAFNISIQPVNDAPSLQIGTGPTVLEDAGVISLTGWASQVSAGPANEQTQTLQVTLTADKPSLFSAQPNLNLTDGDLTFTTAPNAAGSAIVTLRLTDSGGTTNGGINQYERTFTITIQPVNDAPQMQKSSDPIVSEDAGKVTLSGWATLTAGPMDEQAQSLTITTIAENSGLFTVQPAIDRATGTLTFTPAPNVSGSTRVFIQITDNGGTANGGANQAQFSFNITIQPVNDPPHMQIGADVIVDYDAGLVSFESWAVSISPGPADEQEQNMQITLNADTPWLFSEQPIIDLSTGTLTFAVAPGSFGSTIVTILLEDDGGTSNGGQPALQKTFQITVKSPNEPPQLTNFILEGVAGRDLIFSQANFITNFTDQDGDQPATIRIDSLPQNGVLTIQSQPVTAGQELTLAEADLLRFIPDWQWSGTTWFFWSASDGKEFAANPAVVEIQIKPWFYLYLPSLTSDRR